MNELTPEAIREHNERARTNRARRDAALSEARHRVRTFMAKERDSRLRGFRLKSS